MPRGPKPLSVTSIRLAKVLAAFGTGGQSADKKILSSEFRARFLMRELLPSVEDSGMS